MRQHQQTSKPFFISRLLLYFLIAVWGLALVSCASRKPLQSTPESRVVTPTPSPLLKSLPLHSEEFDYFLEIALGAEYGVSDLTVKKWNRDVYIQVLGHPTFEDWRTLYDVVEDLNQLVGKEIRLHIIEGKGNVTVHFVPHSEFYKYEPSGLVFYGGFFWNWWDGIGEITKGRIVIASEGISQHLRDHLIREELTQVLGLMNDSMKYKDSIFYQGYSETTEFSKLDRAVIRMLYSPSIKTGMSYYQLRELFSHARPSSFFPYN